LKERRDQKLGVWVSPDDRLKLPSEHYPVPAGTGGGNTKPVEIAVKSNGLITLIADGRLKLGEMEVTAGGVSAEALRKSDQSVNRGKVAEGRPERFGALLGSFDGFKTSFAVGNGATLKVPANARLLSLIINDGDEGYAKQSGEGFNVQVIQSEISPWMLQDFPELAAKSEGAHVFMPLGANLPSWIVRGEFVTRDYIEINKKRLRIHLPAGSFGYWIRDVGRKPVRPIDLTVLGGGQPRLHETIARPVN
jgi:hypothetical protein